MNKTEIIEAIATEAGIKKSVVGKVLDGFQDLVTVQLSQGEPVAFTGFGSFHAVERAPRIGRNPKTGEPIQIAKSVVPVFRPGKKLKAKVAVQPVS